MGSKSGCITSPPDDYCSAQLISDWESEFRLVNQINIVVAIISLLASLLILLTYFCLNVIRVPSFRVIMFLVFSDLCFSVQSLLLWESPEQVYNRPLCMSQAFISNWSNMSQLGWTTVMALILYYQNKYFMLAQDLFSKKMIIIYSIIGFFLPLIFSLLPFLDAYSPGQYFCWMTIKKDSVTLCNPDYFKNYSDFCYYHNQLFAFLMYAAVWGSIIFNVAIYSRIICMRQKNHKKFRESVQSHQSEPNVASLHLLIFPLGQLIIWIFPTLHRLIMLISPAVGEPYFSILHYCSLSASGIVNMSIYGCNPFVKSQIKAMLFKSTNQPRNSQFEPLILPSRGTEAQYDSD